MSEKKLLIVDDEIKIVDSLKRSFFDDDYEIFSATSAADGLKILEDHQDIAVIISDMKMPGMSGAEFFLKIKTLYPEKIRIILSGYSEISMFHELINKGGIWRFISKPWNDENLRLTINEAFEYYNISQERKKLLEDLKAMNKRLDETVERKTKELLVHNKMLKSILEIHDYPRLFRHLCNAITEITEIKTVAIYSLFSKKTYHAENQAIKPKAQALLEKTKKTLQKEKTENFNAYPICYEQTIEGVLVAEFNNIKEDDFINSIIFIIAIALYDEKSTIDGENTIKNINSIINAMD
ncbi:MAG: response regulator [Spirochaetales bacterium]|nr:response regulator [Spirochaetales bacterium]